jgi:carbonic anhydrase
MKLVLVILAVVAGVCFAKDFGCGPLQKLRVKSDWAAAYKHGNAREEFALAVWHVFLASNPEQKDLFKYVGVDDTRSGEFKAHMARVLGGLDAIISVLENSSVLDEVVGHYADFHKKFGLLPFKEFGKALAVVIESNVGRNRFGAEAWENCFHLIDSKMAEGAFTRQSPIDITQDKTQFDSTLRNPLVINYIPDNVKKITNNGHSIKVSIDYHGSELSGGPLGNKHFCLEQFHFHWGSINSQGSEHTVAGFSYPAEVHLVHWNCERYSSFSEAVPSEDGLAVLGVFLQVSSKSNPVMDILTDTFKDIHNKGQSVDLQAFNPADLLPSDIGSYWYYPGSLTTPPYSETVSWIVFEEPIPIILSQLEQFRHVMNYAQGDDHSDHHGGDHAPGYLVDNYRETQPLYGRVIKASFH